MWIERRKERKEIIVLYQASDANLSLPPGAKAVRVRVRGYRCGREGPCLRDVKIHQELQRKEVRRRCFGCGYLETILERK